MLFSTNCFILFCASGRSMADSAFFPSGAAALFQGGGGGAQEGLARRFLKGVGWRPRLYSFPAAPVTFRGGIEGGLALPCRMEGAAILGEMVGPKHGTENRVYGVECRRKMYGRLWRGIKKRRCVCAGAECRNGITVVSRSIGLIARCRETWSYL